MIAYTTYTYDGRVRLEAESLAAWGYEVFFIVSKEGPKARTFTLNGVTVKELNIPKYGGKNIPYYLFLYIWFIVAAFVSCTSLYLRTRMQVIHVHNMPNFLIFTGLIPRLFGCKLVLDVHDTVIETYQAKFGILSGPLVTLLRLEERICCALAHRIICVNHVQREALIKRGIPASKIVTVITMPRFPAPDRSSRELDHTFRMVNHGTMSVRTGNDLIVRAAAKLAHEIPGFELHIIGGGEDLQAFIRLSESLGLTGHVHFHEGVPWDKLAKKLESMDVGVVANRVNSATALMLPSKLIDYIVLGIPAIVPRLNAIEYYFSPDMVSYFEPENIDSMVEATVRLYKDSTRREQQARNAKSFLDKYGWDNPNTGLKGLYNELFQTTRCGYNQVHEES